MRLIFYSEIKQDDFCGFPVKHTESEKSRLFRPKKPPGGYPPLSIRLFKSIPEDKIILYDIFSLDCCLGGDGKFTLRKISEQDASTLSHQSVIYKNDYHMTPYFRYNDADGQHTVWLEDTYHQIKKLDILKSYGLGEIGILVNNLSAGTVINLIGTERYSI